MRTTGMLRRTLGTAAVLAALTTLMCPSPARAQLKVGDWTLEGGAEAGGRFFINEPPKSRRAKWEEYYDYTGPFLGNLDLRLFSPDDKYWAEFGGSKWGGQDQEFSLSGGRTGLFEFGFDWDQMRHLLSTDAQLLAVQSTSGSVGVFTLPAVRPSLIFYNYAPTLDEIAVRWDTAHTYLKLTPTPDLDITAEYTRTFKHGDKPLGMAFGSPGNNFYEVLQPIDQTVNDFRITGTWAKENYQLQFNYTLSMFNNDLTAVRADNPCFGLAGATAGPLPGCGGDATGPAAGQTSLPPDNIAHTFTFSAGANLPLRTRLTGNFSYSLQRQNQDFLPPTINPTLVPSVDPLPQSSLNGLVQTMLFNLGATSRPIQPLTLTLKYRYFNLNDDSDQITLQSWVLNDRTLEGSARAGRFSFRKQNAEANARWQFGTLAGATLGGGWDWISRNEHREVPISNEVFAKLAVDVTPFDWLLARLTYRPSFRRIDEYNSRAHPEHVVVEEPVDVSQGQSVLLRKYDESERNRQSVQLLLQFTPLETLSITPTASYYYDNYLDTQSSLLSVDPAGQGQRSPFLGVQNATGWQLGADVTWAPVQRLSMSVGYMYENYFRKMESRSRPVVTGAGALDFTDFDWISDINDVYNTVYANLKIAIIPAVLDAAFNASYAGALGTVKSRNPVAPTSGTAAQDTTAKAQRFPAYEDNLFHLEASVAYHFWKNWTAKLGYVYEQWTKQNWQTDTLNPFLPGVTSIWLGNDLRNYTANTIYATLAYTFR